MANDTWAISRISKILPLDEDSLKQVIDYTQTLANDAATQHLRNLLGESPQALDFISSFSARRQTSEDVQGPSDSQPPKSSRTRKTKAPLKKLPPPRQPEDYGHTNGGYQKKEEEDYMASTSRPRKEQPLANTLALSDKPAARQLPKPTTSTPTTSRTASPKPPPSASGPLLSDLPNVRSAHNSRTSSPTPKTTVNLSGGTPMHGASSALADLDSAIKALELQTNPSLSASSTDASTLAKRRCECLATRHPLLASAPNCLNCGKIVCVKEGIGPCTFCSTPLLPSSEIHAMIASLKQERGRERTSINNAAHRRAEVSTTARPFQPPKPNTDAALASAQQHRDKLLDFQAQNARRTRVIDEAADYDTPSSGLSMWSSPVERAAQLKRQQKVLREQEWSAKPEWEKRRVVVSVDLVGGKVVRRMGEVERGGDDEGKGDQVLGGESSVREGGGTGAFGKNPLLGGLVRPVWKGKGQESGANGADGGERQRSQWRRVQDDNDDNEEWSVDGGVYGGRRVDRPLGEEEHAFA